MSVAAQCDTLNSTKPANCNQLPDYRGPLSDVFNCQSGMWPAYARVSPRSLQGAVRWETLGMRLLCGFLIPLLAFWPASANKLEREIRLEHTNAPIKVNPDTPPPPQDIGGD